MCLSELENDVRQNSLKCNKLFKVSEDNIEENLERQIVLKLV